MPDAAEGYQAMDERRAIKVLLTLDRVLASPTDAGVLGELHEEFVLDAGVGRLRVRVLAAAVVPVPPGAVSGGVRAGGEPRLGAPAVVEVVGGPGAAHLGGDPAGVDGVGEDVEAQAARASIRAVTRNFESE